MICSIYSHNPDFDRILQIVQNVYPKGILSTSQQDGSAIIAIEIKGGLFNSLKKIKVSYRQRNIPSYHLPDIDDSPLTTNLKGMYGMVSSLPAKNEKIKDLLLHKIPTLNCEFSVMQEQGETKEIKKLLQTLANDFDAILFVQPGTVISRSAGQHFLDRNLNLIIDGEGNCEINNLEVKINTTYFDNDQGGLTKDQQERKEKSEKFLEARNIKINRHLPAIESEEDIVIRSPREIAQRVSILAITNLVAFNTITSEEAIAYLQQYDLWEHVTPGEKNFLADPTEEKKNHETWKCEGIWTLMWALKKVDELGPLHELCNLQNIRPEDYPVGHAKNPNDFIGSINSARSKSEILDAADLYYRLDWACVDARINNRPIQEAHPGLVYERHYTLNWLIHYMDQEWDDISCDT